MLKVIKGILGLAIIVGVALFVWNWWTDRSGEEKPLEDMVGNFTDNDEWVDKQEEAGVYDTDVHSCFNGNALIYTNKADYEHSGAVGCSREVDLNCRKLP